MLKLNQRIKKSIITSVIYVIIPTERVYPLQFDSPWKLDLITLKVNTICKTIIKYLLIILLFIRNVQRIPGECLKIFSNHCIHYIDDDKFGWLNVTGKKTTYTDIGPVCVVLTLSVGNRTTVNRIGEHYASTYYNRQSFKVEYLL